MMIPTCEEILKLADNYDTIPICSEVYADVVTPITLLRRIAARSSRFYPVSYTQLNVKSMCFNQADRMALLRLLMTDEKKLDNLTIQDWFKETPHIFETNFWHCLLYTSQHIY